MIFFQFATRNIRLHWLRSFLAVTGVVIGVAAIASMGILGNSLVLSISESLTDVGDTIVITAHSGGGADGDGPPIAVSGRGVTDLQVNEIRRAAGSNQVIPIMSGSDRFVIGGETTAAPVYGISPTDLPDLLEVTDGTSLRGESGAMVGAVLAEDYDLLPGSRLRIGEDEEKLRVTGVLEERGVGFDINPDRAVIVSDEFYKDFYDAEEWNLVIVKVSDLEEIDIVKESIDDQLNRREDEVDVLDTRAILETLIDTFNRISTFTTAIGGISLIVAGVSIFNVMMMSVTERTREIGVIRSIGARQGEVLRIFLYESLILGLVGSAIGAVLSLFGGYLALAVMLEETKYLFEPTSLIAIPYGAAFGIATSLLSGAYPAWKASHLSPIEALRHE
ncbi:ABC transporter permease [Methanofollis formosanus]|uniref:ABC transporter permease n=2 Tax=Methanofollis formosanus TaxID=299308 RepID=A0A8G1A4I0_9EURY|nr:ABC transporter permease [Methanofollis formosanus]